MFASLIFVLDIESCYSLFEAGNTKTFFKQCEDMNGIFKILLCSEVQLIRDL